MTRLEIETEFFTVKGTLNNHRVKKSGLSPQTIYNMYYEVVTPKCTCGQERTFYTFPKGYRLTCSSRICAANAKEGMLKRKATNIAKYGVEEFPTSVRFREACLQNLGAVNPSFLQTCLDKGRDTKIAKGSQIPDEDRTEWELYKKLVLAETRKNCTNLKNIHLRGHIKNDPDAYHLDHKVSVYYGFINNILPTVIGNTLNLEMIPARTNMQKRTKCSATLEDITVQAN